MNRIWTLSLYLTRCLFRSLAGVIPLAYALVFGLVAFEYGMDQSQFITVGGLGIGGICLLATVLLTSQANRAGFYPLLARLRRRSELLGAAGLGGLGTTAILALLITVTSLLTHRLILHFPSLLWIAPTWLALWLFLTSLSLSLSSLVNRNGSQLLGYVVVVGVLVANDRESWLIGRGLDWLVRAVDFFLWPLSTLLTNASAGDHGRTYFLALAGTLVYALLLFALAAQLFERKDLLWPE